MWSMRKALLLCAGDWDFATRPDDRRRAFDLFRAGNLPLNFRGVFYVDVFRQPKQALYALQALYPKFLR